MKTSIHSFGLVAGCIGALTCLTCTAPPAIADADCSQNTIAGTVSSVTGSASTYLTNHPDANQVVVAAYSQPRDQAESNLRTFFTAHPQEYQDLRAILAPIGDTQRRCNVTVLSPELASEYAEFMTG